MVKDGYEIWIQNYFKFHLEIIYGIMMNFIKAQQRKMGWLGLVVQELVGINIKSHH